MSRFWLWTWNSHLHAQGVGWWKNSKQSDTISSRVAHCHAKEAWNGRLLENTDSKRCPLCLNHCPVQGTYASKLDTHDRKHSPHCRCCRQKNVHVLIMFCHRFRSMCTSRVCQQEWSSYAMRPAFMQWQKYAKINNMCCMLHVHFSDRKSLSFGPVDLQRKASIPLAARLPEMSSNMLGAIRL